MNGFLILQIRELAESPGGMDFLRGVQSGFSCPKNGDIQNFLQERALDFAKRRVSVTHLVVDSGDRACVGYFTLAHKAFPVKAESLSRTKAKKIERFAKFDHALSAYVASAFLIAQLGKNYAVDGGKRISGRALLQLAMDELTLAEREIGGDIVCVECTEGNAFLEGFYEGNGFFRAGRRVSDSDGNSYTQFFAFLR